MNATFFSEMKFPSLLMGLKLKKTMYMKTKMHNIKFYDRTRHTHSQMTSTSCQRLEAERKMQQMPVRKITRKREQKWRLDRIVFMLQSESTELQCHFAM